MRKLTHRLLIILTMLVLTFGAAITTPDPIPTTEASGSDCDALAKTCRSMSQGLYLLCIELGGPADQCAWNEAQNTIDCIKATGCPYNN